MCEARPGGAGARPTLVETRGAHGASGRSKRTRSIASALRRSRPVQGRIASGIGRLLSALDLALDVRRERRMLLTMDDRALKDIGFNRSEAWVEAHRSLWDIPRDRLLL